VRGADPVRDAGRITAAVVGVVRWRSVDDVSWDQSILSVAGACLGGVGALVVGGFGILTAMAPLLEAVPQARNLTTSLLLAVYLAALLAGSLIESRLRLATLLRLLAGVVAGPVVVAYTLFVLVKDSSPDSHRLLMLVWLIATAAGLAAGALWACVEAKGDIPEGEAPAEP
jgi:predicted MFS family arabinose efflux permease